MMYSDFFPAIRRGAVDAVLTMVAASPSLLDISHPSGVSPVLYALYHGQDELALLLAERKSDLAVYELAALGLDEQLRAALKSQPATVNRPGPDGLYPLGQAAYFGRFSTCALLLDAGAQPDQPAANELGYTPLHLAVLGGHLQVAALLLQKGASPCLLGSDGQSALHLAAGRGDMQAVRLLLYAGCNPALPRHDGLTAFDLARQGGHWQVEMWLRRRVAQPI